MKAKLNEIIQAFLITGIIVIPVILGFIYYIEKPVYHYIPELGLHLKIYEPRIFKTKVKVWFSKTDKFDSDCVEVVYGTYYRFRIYGTDTIGFVNIPDSIRSIEQKDFYIFKEKFDPQTEMVVDTYRAPDYYMRSYYDLFYRDLQILDLDGNIIYSESFR